MDFFLEKYFLKIENEPASLQDIAQLEAELGYIFRLISPLSCAMSTDLKDLSEIPMPFLHPSKQSIKCR